MARAKQQLQQQKQQQQHKKKHRNNHNAWEDARPIHTLSELPDAIKSRTKRVETARTRAYIAAQRKAQQLARPSSSASPFLPRSRHRTKTKSLAQASAMALAAAAASDNPSNPASVLTEFELSQRSYTRKLTSPKQVGFMRALNKIEKKHNVTSFTQHMEQFKVRSRGQRGGQKKKKPTDGRLEWRTLKL